jgi:hypothetical protein
MAIEKKESTITPFFTLTLMVIFLERDVKFFVCSFWLIKGTIGEGKYLEGLFDAS